MTTNILIHVVGRVDVGAENDLEINDQLTKVEQTPGKYIDLVLEKERQHGVDFPPIIRTLQLAEKNNCWPDVIILLGTEQTPAHIGDTLRIATLVKEILPRVDLFLAPITQDVRVVRITRMTAKAYSKAIKENVSLDEGRKYFLSIAGGGKAPFNGTLTGLLNVGIIPSLLEANTSEDREPIDLHQLVGSMSDIRRYLTRKRMWWPLAENLVDDPDSQKYLRELHYGEHRHAGKQRNRSSSLELGISSLFADLAVGDQGWGRKMTRLVEMRGREIVEKHERSDGNFPKEALGAAYRNARQGEGGEEIDTADQISWMAKKNCDEWRELVTVPNQVREFWDDTEHRRGARGIARIARHFRHRIITDQNYRNFEQQTFPDLYELLSSDQTDKFELDRFASKVSEFGYGVPWTWAAPVTQVVRAIGEREDIEIQDAISKFIAIAPSVSRDVMNFKSMKSDQNDIDLLSRRLLLEMQVREFNLFKEHKSRITAIEVILGQGTKAMNLAMIIAGTVHSFHLDVPLKLYEAPKSPNSTTEVQEIAVISSQKLKRQLLPDTAVISAIAGSLSVINLKQAALLSELLSIDKQELNSEIQLFRTEVDFPFEGPDGNSAENSFRHGMPAVTFLMSHRDVNGDCDAVSRISPLLSAMTDSIKKPKDSIDDEWKSDQDLRLLWRQRNNALHHNIDPGGKERFAIWPPELTEQIIFDRFADLLKIESAEIRNNVRDKIRLLKTKFENIENQCA